MTWNKNEERDFNKRSWDNTYKNLSKVIERLGKEVEALTTERDEMEVLIGQYRDGLTHDEIQRLHKLEAKNATLKTDVQLLENRLATVLKEIKKLEGEEL